MSYYGAHWRIDGVTAAFIMRGDRNGRYRIVFERESAELPQIESINWAQPICGAPDGGRRVWAAGGVWL